MSAPRPIPRRHRFRLTLEVLILSSALTGAVRQAAPGDIAESRELGDLVLHFIELGFWVTTVCGVLLALAGIGYGVLEWVHKRSAT